MPDGVLKSSAAIVSLLSRASLDVILDSFSPIEMSGRLLRHEGASNPVFLHEITGDMSKLGRKILMDEKDVHVNSQLVSWSVVHSQ